MNNRFDELAKGLAQSVTRRQAFKKFGVALAGMVVACFGMADKASADKVCLSAGQACGYKGALPCCPYSHCKTDTLTGGSYCVSRYPIG